MQKSVFIIAEESHAVKIFCQYKILCTRVWLFAAVGVLHWVCLCLQADARVCGDEPQAEQRGVCGVWWGWSVIWDGLPGAADWDSETSARDSPNPPVLSNTSEAVGGVCSSGTDRSCADKVRHQLSIVWLINRYRCSNSGAKRIFSNHFNSLCVLFPWNH